MTFSHIPVLFAKCRTASNFYFKLRTPILTSIIDS